MLIGTNYTNKKLHYMMAIKGTLLSRSGILHVCSSVNLGYFLQDILTDQCCLIGCSKREVDGGCKTENQLNGHETRYTLGN